MTATGTVVFNQREEREAGYVRVRDTLFRHAVGAVNRAEYWLQQLSEADASRRNQLVQAALDAACVASSYIDAAETLRLANSMVPHTLRDTITDRVAAVFRVLREQPEIDWFG